MKASRPAVLLVLLLMVGGCSLSIQLPETDGASVCPPVKIQLQWQGTMSNFRAKLDGVDVTAQIPGLVTPMFLNATPGTHTLVIDADLTNVFGTSHFTRTRTFTVPSLSTAIQSASLKLAKNGSAQTAITAWSCAPTVDFTFTSTPPGITANPATKTLTIPPPVDPGVTTSRGNTFSELLQASAATGRYTINVHATSGTDSDSKTITVDVGTPTVTGVTPAVQMKGQPITIAGTDFNPMCVNNTVTLGGANVSATTCSPAGTSVTINVPDRANYGPTQLAVSVNGLSSNGVPFTVARQSGTFATPNVISNVTQSQSCTTTSGIANTLQIAPFGTGMYRATFSGPTGAFGTLGFAMDHASPGGVGNVGGAGFSACVAGVVLNAGPPELDFINLETHTQSTGHTFATQFANEPGPPSGEIPRVFNSPDGTLFVLVSPRSFIDVTDSSYYVQFFDLDKVRFGQNIKTMECVNTVGTPQVTANNDVVFTCGATQSTFAIQ